MAQPLHFAWLELLSRCNLACTHCYAGSSPAGDLGTMSFADWTRVIEQAAELGVTDVQFIGGEPTLHPQLPDLIGHALAKKLNVEVFTNLLRISEPLWEAFAQPGVSLATSYYSDQTDEHDQITTRRGSHARTKANIAEAVRRSIPLRTGVIDMGGGQRATGAVVQLQSLGVQTIGTDQLRQVGRGVRDQQANVEQLCGNCAAGVLAISPTGQVWPCVFSRWLPVGNAKTDSLASILDGTAIAGVRTMLTEHFATRPDLTPRASPKKDPCKPASSPCHPQCGPACQPNCSPRCSPSCSPCAPGKRCWPHYR